MEVAMAARSLSLSSMSVRRRRRILYKAVFEAKPIADINTTPLIDVMLVLLIMIMITLPVMSHKIPIDLPQAGPSTDAPPPVNLLDIARSGALSWNGEPVPTGTLRTRLAAHMSDPAQPVLHLKSDDATRYERFDETLAIVKAAGVTKLGFVKNGGAMDW
jgi:biopolymer transport protein ExbD